MTNTPRNQLERAYRLIQQDHLDEAIAILNPIVAKNSDNADACWLLANAVSEPEEARRALDNVLRINPGHMQARDLLEKLEQEFPAYAGSANQSFGGFFDNTRVADDEALDAAFNANPFDTDRMPSFVSDDAKSGTRAGASGRNFVDDSAGAGNRASTALAGRRVRRSSPARMLLLALLLIVILVGAAVFLLNRSPALAPSGSPTSVAAVSSATAGGTTVSGSVATTSATSTTGTGTQSVTGAATAMPSVMGSATESVAQTPNGTQSASGTLDNTLKAITNKFRAGGTADAEARLDSSSLGKTLFVRFCSKAGPDLTKTVNTARELLATESIAAKNDVQAIGVEVVSCANVSQSLYKAVASMQDAAAFVDKSIDARKFRASWKTG